MIRRSHFQTFALLLCVLALFVVQAFGAKAGFYCLCAGTPVPTEASSCYGPHGENCAEEEAHGGAPKDGEGTDRRDHQVVSQDVQMRTAEAAQQMIAPQVLLALLPMAKILFAGREAGSGSHWVDFGKSPPLGVTVARTVVLLI